MLRSGGMMAISVAREDVFAGRNCSWTFLAPLQEFGVGVVIEIEGGKLAWSCPRRVGLGALDQSWNFCRFIDSPTSKQSHSHNNRR